MKFKARAFDGDTEIFIEREGLHIGKHFLDYADIKSLSPINHRVLIDTFPGEKIEISMLGFAYDGFWEELMKSFSQRSLEALFVDETVIMHCEGEYQIFDEKGRAIVMLFPDAICILPQTCHAIRIPLTFTREIQLDGYMLHITMFSGQRYSVGRMGYDTRFFAERAKKAANRVKRQRSQGIEKVQLQAPFSQKGLFRTQQADHYWQAAFGKGRCAVELFTDENSATYLYEFLEEQSVFVQHLEEAMEAMGSHREIIYFTEEQIQKNSLYRMAIGRCEAVRFLRSKSVGRLIHNSSHSQRLAEFIENQYSWAES